MADRVVFIGWNRPVAGREKQAMQLFQKSMEYYAHLQKDGKIEGFEAVILAPHGGDLNGFVMLKGDAKKLSEIGSDDTFLQLSIEAGYCLDGFGVVPAHIGEGVTKALAQWSKLIGS